MGLRSEVFGGFCSPPTDLRNSQALLSKSFFLFTKSEASQRESPEESKGKFKMHTESLAVLFQQRKLFFEEHGTDPGPSFSEALTTA